MEGWHWGWSDPTSQKPDWVASSGYSSTKMERFGAGGKGPSGLCATGVRNLSQKIEIRNAEQTLTFCCWSICHPKASWQTHSRWFHFHTFQYTSAQRTLAWSKRCTPSSQSRRCPATERWQPSWCRQNKRCNGNHKTQLTDLKISPSATSAINWLLTWVNHSFHR